MTNRKTTSWVMMAIALGTTMPALAAPTRPLKLVGSKAPGVKRGIDERAYGFYTKGANQNVLDELKTKSSSMGVYDLRNYVTQRYNDAWKQARTQGIGANEFQRQWDQNKW